MVPSALKRLRYSSYLRLTFLRFMSTRRESLALSRENTDERLAQTWRAMADGVLRMVPEPSTYWARRGSLAVRPWILNGTNDSTSTSQKYLGTASGKVSWMKFVMAHASAVPPMPFTPPLKVRRPVSSSKSSGMYRMERELPRRTSCGACFMFSTASALMVRSDVVTVGSSFMPMRPYGSARVLNAPTMAITTRAAATRTSKNQKVLRPLDWSISGGSGMTRFLTPDCEGAGPSAAAVPSGAAPGCGRFRPSAPSSDCPPGASREGTPGPSSSGDRANGSLSSGFTAVGGLGVSARAGRIPRRV